MNNIKGNNAGNKITMQPISNARFQGGMPLERIVIFVSSQTISNTSFTCMLEPIFGKTTESI